MGILLKILEVLLALITIRRTIEPPEISMPEPEPEPETNAALVITEQPSRPTIEIVQTIPKDVKKLGYSKDIDHCRPKLKTAFEYAQPKFLGRHPALWVRCDFTYRSVAYQRTLYMKGRSYDEATDTWTIIDPRLIVTKVLKSHHNTWLADAFDFIIFSGKKPLWVTKETKADIAPLYQEYGKLCQEKGVVSGAVWKYRWKDYGHVQGGYGAV